MVGCLSGPLEPLADRYRRHVQVGAADHQQIHERWGEDAVAETWLSV